MRKQNWETAPRLTSHDEQLIGMRRFRNIVEGSQNDPSIYEWVDLGLPSGLKWATCNVGATKPEEYGLYFAWGETEGYSGITDTKKFKWADYKLCDGTSSTLTKYNSDSPLGTVDNLTTLEQVDDAAYTSDNTCRMPTKAEIKELIANTTSTWETLNGVDGRRFTSKTNGNSIFIPATGGYNSGSVSGVGYSGYLWSSTLAEDGSLKSRRACYFDFSSNGAYTSDYYNRCCGFTVRPVKSK